MIAYWISFRLGASVDLRLHNILVTGDSMPDAVARFHEKIWRKFPMYQVVTCLPAGGLELDRAVEVWRDRA